MTPDDLKQSRVSTRGEGGDDAPPGASPVLNYAGIAAPLRMATVATYGDVAEAHLACGALERAGINAVLDGEHVAANVHGYAPAMGTLALRVEEQHLDRARGVLDEIVAGKAKRLRYESLTCPACASSQIRRTPHRRAVGVTLLALGLVGCVFDGARPVAVMLLLIAAYILITPEYARYRCDACRHRWHASALDDTEDDEDEDGEPGEGIDDANVVAPPAPPATRP